MSQRMPPLRRNERGYEVLSPGSTLTLGRIEHGPNMHGWGWTVGLGWHTGLATVGAALDALLADPAFGVDVHSEGRPSASGTAQAVDDRSPSPSAVVAKGDSAAPGGAA